MKTIKLFTNPIFCTYDGNVIIIIKTDKSTETFFRSIENYSLCEGEIIINSNINIKTELIKINGKIIDPYISLKKKNGLNIITLDKIYIRNLIRDAWRC